MSLSLTLFEAALAASIVVAPAAVDQEAGAAKAPQDPPPAEAAPPAKRAIEASDYAKWEKLGYSSELSPDGRWLAYSVSTVGGKGELRLRMLATDSTEVFENGMRPEFSADSNWLAFLIGVSEEEREKLQKGKKPIEYELGLHDLVTGETTEIERVASFDFSDDGKFLIMRRYGPKGGEGHGADIVLRNLATKVDTNFGNVGSYAWNDDGTLLAMIVSAEDKAGNGVRLYDAATGILRTLDSADETYKQLTWREDSTDLAVLREKSPEEGDGDDEDEKDEEDEEGEKDDELTHDVLAWRGLDKHIPGRKVYDALKDESFPRAMRIVDTAGLRWADDGATLFFGVKELENPPEEEPEKAKEAPKAEPEEKPEPVGGEKPETPVSPDEKEQPEKPTEPADAEKEGGQVEKTESSKPAPSAADEKEVEPAEAKPGDGQGEKKKKEKKKEKKEEKKDEDVPKSLRETLKDPAGVEVWHAKDIEIIPRQKKTASRDKRESFLAAWWLEDGHFVQLGSELTEDVRLLEEQKHAVGTDNTPYETEKRYGPTMVDVYLVDARTGERQKLLERLKYVFGSGPGGRHLLYIKDGQFWTYDREAAQHQNLTGESTTSFIDRENSSLTDEKPPHGICGWSADGETVYLYDRFDVWGFRADGSEVTRLTRGAEKEIRYRRVILDPDEDEFIDPARTMYLSLYGEKTKKSGYARILPGESPQTLLWEGKAVGRLSKAEEAEIYSYVSQSYDDSPDFFVTGPELVKPRQATETNPWQDDYLWGRTELVDYANVHGEELQGALIYPAGYEPGKKYPMIVYIYEELSQTLHSYSAPTERHPYNPAVFSAQGYFVFKPDIVYRPQNPGLSAKECLEPAVKAAVATGRIDEAKVGLVGHSWGAYQTAFMVTHSDLFAAGVAGAPLTNMISMAGSIYWNSGQTDSWIFHESQGRMDTPFWTDFKTYIENSPIFGIEQMNTPLLIAFGDEDGAVDWNQGVEMYNAARLAQKPLVMLVYAGENHSLREKPNQVDYHYRVLEWFNHYLKGDEAPSWITEGQSYLDRQEEIEELKEAKGKKGK